MIRSNLAKLKESWSLKHKKYDRTKSEPAYVQPPSNDLAASQTAEDGPNEQRVGSVRDMIQETLIISGGIAATVFKEKNFEPLPFTDYSMFEESYGKFCRCH